MYMTTLLANYIHMLKAYIQRIDKSIANYMNYYVAITVLLSSMLSINNYCVIDGYISVG